MNPVHTHALLPTPTIYNNYYNSQQVTLPVHLVVNLLNVTSVLCSTIQTLLFQQIPTFSHPKQPPKIPKRKGTLAVHFPQPTTLQQPNNQHHGVDPQQSTFMEISENEISKSVSTSQHTTTPIQAQPTPSPILIPAPTATPIITPILIPTTASTPTPKPPKPAAKQGVLNIPTTPRAKTGKNSENLDNMIVDQAADKNSNLTQAIKIPPSPSNTIKKKR